MHRLILRVMIGLGLTTSNIWAVEPEAGGKSYVCDLGFGLSRTLVVKEEKLLIQLKTGSEPVTYECPFERTQVIDHVTYRVYSICKGKQQITESLEATFLPESMLKGSETAKIKYAGVKDTGPNTSDFNCVLPDFEQKNVIKLRDKLEKSIRPEAPQDLVAASDLPMLKRSKVYYQVIATDFANLPGQSPKYHEVVLRSMQDKLDSLADIPTKVDAVGFLNAMLAANANSDATPSAVRNWAYGHPQALAFYKKLHDIERDPADREAPLDEMYVAELKQAKDYYSGIYEAYKKSHRPHSEALSSHLRSIKLDLEVLGARPFLLDAINFSYEMYITYADPLFYGGLCIRLAVK